MPRLNAEIVQFPASRIVRTPGEAKQEPPFHPHDCPCLGCHNQREMIEYLHGLTPPDWKDPIVVAYEDSLMKGLEVWAKNPMQSMFKAVTEQLIEDGIIA